MGIGAGGRGAIPWSEGTEGLTRLLTLGSGILAASFVLDSAAIMFKVELGFCYSKACVLLLTIELVLVALLSIIVVVVYLALKNYRCLMVV